VSFIIASAKTNDAVPATMAMTAAIGRAGDV
jgi:hypothetical protein